MFSYTLWVIERFAGRIRRGDNNPDTGGFAGSLRGGKNAAIFYSVVGTCKLLGVPPFEYLRDVLSRISTHPQRLIHELTPAGWKAAREAATAQHG